MMYTVDVHDGDDLSFYFSMASRIRERIHETYQNLHKELVCPVCDEVPVSLTHGDTV